MDEPDLVHAVNKPRSRQAREASSMNSIRFGRAAVLAVAFALLLPAAAAAQGEGPRAYWKAPANTHAVGTWMMLFNGNASGVNTAVPIEGAAIDTRVYLANYTAFFNLLGRRNQVSATMPFGSIRGTTTGFNPVNLDVAAKGAADPTVFWALNLIGAPAQTLVEYSQWEQRTILDAQIYMTAPLGSYDDERLLNLGTNRWTVRLGLPFVQSIGDFKPGRRTTLELTPSMTFFTDNDSAFRGTSVLEQDPLYKLEGHVTRDITDKLWVSADALWQAGGETTVDGEKQDNSQSSLGLGFTVGFGITEEVAFQGTWGNTLTDPEDGLNMNMLWLRFTYAWNPTAQAMAKQQAEAAAGTR